MYSSDLHVAAALFLSGCNMRCGYCHNPELVLAERLVPSIPVEEAMIFRKSRVGRLIETARKIQIKYKHLIDILFMEPNPIPVKVALELMGYKVGKLRLSLTKASNETVLKLKEEMRNLKII